MRVGIVGGGQLGRMLALAGHPLGITCISLDPAANSPAGQVSHAIVGAYDDEGALAALAAASDVATYEFENVPVQTARFLAERLPVYPPPEALEASQDRLAEKVLFDEVGIPTARAEAVASVKELDRASRRVGLPAVLKTRRFGYDGKGQVVVRDVDQLVSAWRSIDEAPAMLEAFIGFDRELSIVGVRGRGGETAFYPLVENHHDEGILRMTVAPAPDLARELQEDAEAIGRAVMDRLGYVGVLAIELFQVGTELLANEMAPRVHNSGHWTVEGAATSQFENHLRAVCGLPIGPTTARSLACMVNVIGSEPGLEELLRIPGVHVHRYGKVPRPGRKLGHVTILAEDTRTLDRRALQVRSISTDVSPRWPT